MYCPKCELEIRGDDKKTCPICEATLTENPFEKSVEQGEDSMQDNKLKELIEDIDKKVSSSLDDEDVGLSMELDAETPQPDGFKLELEDQPESETDYKREQEFVLSDNVKKSEGETIDGGDQEESYIAEEKLEGTKGSATVPINDSEVEEGLEQGREDKTVEESKIDFDMEHDVDFAKDEIIVSEEIPAVFSEEEKTTQDILDKALDEFDSISEEEMPDGAESPTRKFPMFAGIIIFLVIVIGGAAYYLKTRTGYVFQSTSVEKAVVKHDMPLKKPLKKDGATNIIKQIKPVVAAEKKPVVLEEGSDNKIVQEKSEVREPSVLQADVKTVTEPEKNLPIESVKPLVKKKNVAINKENKKPETSVKTKPATSVSYSIHAGSFRNKEAADGESLRFNRKGFDARVELTDLSRFGKGIWYRVKIGRFASIDKANEVQKKLHQNRIKSRIIKNKP